MQEVVKREVDGASEEVWGLVFSVHCSQELT